MFVRRQRPALSFANAAMSFALGAALTLSVHEAMRRARLRSRTKPVADDVVLENVRSRAAEILSDPRAVRISVENGIVRLSGHVPAEERDRLLTQLLWLPGVIRLRNALGTM